MSAEGDALTTAGGTGVAWGRLGRISFAVIVVQIFAEFAELVEAGFQAFVLNPLVGIGRFLGGAVNVFFAPVSPGGALRQWAAGSEAFLGQLGPWAFPVALLIVLVIAWVFARGREFSA